MHIFKLCLISTSPIFFFDVSILIQVFCFLPLNGPWSSICETSKISYFSLQVYEDNTLLPEVKIIENNKSHPDSENSGESPESQVNDDVNSEGKNVSPEENGAVSYERGTVPQKKLWCQTRKWWKRIKNCTFQSNAQCKVRDVRMPSYRMVSEGKIIS